MDPLKLIEAVRGWRVADVWYRFKMLEAGLPAADSGSREEFSARPLNQKTPDVLQARTEPAKPEITRLAEPPKGNFRAR